MPKVTPLVQSAVERALEQYKAEVNDAPLKPNTRGTYKRHAEVFVRWMRGDFEPGSKAKRR